MWSDPDEEEEGWIISQRGAGWVGFFLLKILITFSKGLVSFQLFGSRAAKQFVEDNGLELICRCQFYNVPILGIEIFTDRTSW